MLKKDVLIYEFPMTIPSYLVGCGGVTRLENLFMLFQESAWHHAEKLGFGFDTMKEKKLIWLLYRLRIKTFSMPRWGQRISIKTWPLEARKIYAYRFFSVNDEMGKKLLEATSTWILADTEHRHPASVKPNIDPHLNTLTEGNKHCPDDFSTQLPRKIPSFKIADESIASVKPRFSDMDVHSHTTNSTYVRWISDALANKGFVPEKIESFEINFLSEVLAGDTVDLFISKESFSEVSVIIKHRKSGRHAARAYLKIKDDNASLFSGKT